ncbi:alpha/beta fold hydrolase [Streptomyces wuyuanensis]|uniref:Pimeloyl-ACP methyl ester carboxylesterase n=1 Tax=Streptomyces wuyuanensis TaxID=1196353 RepID=A0A1G9NRD7_9ACTN|nr:alpha/beta fold hydrolase [Streptomyces wuyuanensis]SDL88555.1 Pimeloyl-ACP methyl ester carboxylesterase [Streptomyces wuyuanensis]
MTIAHDVAGDGPAVVLLHSSVCDRRMWDEQRDALTGAGYRVVRPDFRGFGGTPAEAVHPYSDEDDVLALLDELGIERAAFVGASYGGGVAVGIAARRPERVTALALLCAALPGHEPGPGLLAFDRKEDELVEAGDLDAAVELNVATWLGPEAGEPVRERVRAMQRHAFDVQLAADAEAERAGLEPVEGDDPQVDPGAVTAPALVVSGAHDLDDFKAMAARFAELIPGARAVELPWAGHLPSLERPAEVTDLLRDFLRDSGVLREGGAAPVSPAP